VETPAPALKSGAAKGIKPEPGSDEEAKEGGVRFGKVDEDPDDPFPELGGDPAKPRDFAW
jgi:hypothetical protein